MMPSAWEDGDDGALCWPPTVGDTNASVTPQYQTHSVPSFKR